MCKLPHLEVGREMEKETAYYVKGRKKKKEETEVVFS